MVKKRIHYCNFCQNFKPLMEDKEREFDERTGAIITWGKCLDPEHAGSKPGMEAYGTWSYFTCMWVKWERHFILRDGVVIEDG